jgi:hypothetical protein
MVKRSKGLILRVVVEGEGGGGGGREEEEKECARGRVEVLHRYLSGRNMENYGYFRMKTVGVLAETRTQHLQNMRQVRYPYSIPLSFALLDIQNMITFLGDAVWIGYCIY